MTIPKTEPTTFRAGDTVQWTKTLADYPATLWDLSYVLNGAEGVKKDIVVTDSGNSFACKLPATKTKDYTAGMYQLISSVTDGTDRYSLEPIIVTVLPDKAAATTGTDARSQYQQELDAINAALLDYASNPAEEVTVNGRMVRISSIVQLKAYRNDLRSLLAKEKRRENQKRGNKAGGAYKIRF
jgi:hypothetical protein